jgi:hypothetical protein
LVWVDSNTFIYNLGEVMGYSIFQRLAFLSCVLGSSVCASKSYADSFTYQIDFGASAQLDVSSDETTPTQSEVVEKLRPLALEQGQARCSEMLGVGARIKVIGQLNVQESIQRFVLTVPVECFKDISSLDEIVPYLTQTLTVRDEFNELPQMLIETHFPISARNRQVASLVAVGLVNKLHDPATTTQQVQNVLNNLGHMFAKGVGDDYTTVNGLYEFGQTLLGASSNDSDLVDAAAGAVGRYIQVSSFLHRKLQSPGPMHPDLLLFMSQIVSKATAVHGAGSPAAINVRVIDGLLALNMKVEDDSSAVTIANNLLYALNHRGLSQGEMDLLYSTVVMYSELPVGRIPEAVYYCIGLEVSERMGGVAADALLHLRQHVDIEHGDLIFRALAAVKNQIRFPEVKERTREVVTLIRDYYAQYPSKKYISDLAQELLQ